jgi:hypothetical protein
MRCVSNGAQIKHKCASKEGGGYLQRIVSKVVADAYLGACSAPTRAVSSRAAAKLLRVAADAHLNQPAAAEYGGVELVKKGARRREAAAAASTLTAS